MNNLTHAGGIVTRTRDGEALVLLVRATRPPHQWVLPKGHIDGDETPEATARREVQEEAGVDAEVVSYLGQMDFLRGSEEVRAGFFLMRFVGSVAPTEQRETRWCPFDDAEQLVQFERTRELLAAARRSLTS
jgi:8-oxo-dGTP pyrophosphatase MutT (NUDIX family)